MAKRCRYPEGMVIKPDGVNILDPCHYRVLEIHKNVTVRVLQCEKCGHIELEWLAQDDTESTIYAEMAPEPDDDDPSTVRIEERIEGEE